MTKKERKHLLGVFSVLTGARLLLSDRRSWIKESYARVTPTGKSVRPEDPAATCWCSAGGITAVAPDGTKAAEFRPEAFQELAKALPGRSVINFNDDGSTRHSMVLARFDRAIENVAMKLNTA